MQITIKAGTIANTTAGKKYDVSVAHRQEATQPTTIVFVVVKDDAGKDIAIDASEIESVI
jgi:hypothetical protein